MHERFSRDGVDQQREMVRREDVWLHLTSLAALLPSSPRSPLSRDWAVLGRFGMQSQMGILDAKLERVVHVHFPMHGWVCKQAVRWSGCGQGRFLRLASHGSCVAGRRMWQSWEGQEQLSSSIGHGSQGQVRERSAFCSRLRQRDQG
ncbi:hypothetical protein E4T42_04350 [Aureobasidium subglaciale]|nr:hypothetical protein E4T42_04350 [Aureobasidium subglaciale]